MEQGKVLVTGAFGNVGACTMRHLLDAGRRVVAVDLKNPRTSAIAARFGNEVEVAWGNICDPQLWRSALKDVDAVIHLAALMPPLTERMPDRATAVNVTATRLMMQCMEESPTAKRLVFASSMGVAGNQQHRRKPPLTVDEAPQPTDFYGQTKVQCEGAIRASTLRWSILRLAVCPPTELSMKDGGSFELIFDTTPDGRIELIHNDDAGLAFANAAMCDEAVGKTLHIGGGPRCRSKVIDFYNQMFTTMGLGPLDPRVLRAGPTQFYGDWLDTSESQRLLAFQRHGIDDILADLKASVGAWRWLLRIASPLVGRMIARRSPNLART